MGEVIIFFVLGGAISLYLGFRGGFIYGFKRMNDHAVVQAQLFSQELIRDGKYTNDELLTFAYKSQEKYMLLIKQQKDNN